MTVGPGLDLPHPWGIVIGGATIGRNCVLYHNVTIGVRAPHLTHRRPRRPELPTIGDDVIIYAGAMILGPITVGDRAIIGANAMVTQDVPPDTMVGVDAKLLTRSMPARG
jgi:serine O-acetyltransferase